MNNNLYNIKNNFCQFNYPFKNKENIDDFIDDVKGILDDEDLDLQKYQKKIISDEIKYNLKYLDCKLCPLEDFITRLEEENIIEE